MFITILETWGRNQSSSEVNQRCIVPDLMLSLNNLCFHMGDFVLAFADLWMRNLCFALAEVHKAE